MIQPIHVQKLKSHELSLARLSHRSAPHQPSPHQPHDPSVLPENLQYKISTSLLQSSCSFLSIYIISSGFYICIEVSPPCDMLRIVLHLRLRNANHGLSSVPDLVDQWANFISRCPSPCVTIRCVQSSGGPDGCCYRLVLSLSFFLFFSLFGMSCLMLRCFGYGSGSLVRTGYLGQRSRLP